ncbi:hypothetical protein HDU93_002722, partial [Gonapodya sp. JEL0774]
PLPVEESHRRIERGATIVTAVQGGLAVILQMPRGNLETIYPRALAIAAVQKLLDKSSYREALELCRNHRIDMNILSDHNRVKFVEELPRFVSDVAKVDYFNLFVSGLKDEDVTTTQYKAFYPAKALHSSESGKATLICQTLRLVLEATKPEEYLHSILTTFVKESPPQLTEALAKIRELRKSQGTKAADDATKYIVFLVDANTLFDVALGMYDFGLVMMVAQHSHKDPKEYLAFLSQLRSLERPIQRFRIDDYLSRHEKALKNLSEAGPAHFDKALAYVSRHKLHTVALEIYPEATAPEEHRALLKLFGQRLLEERNYKEAGIMLDRAHSYDSAVDSYAKGLFWREAVASAYALNMNKEKLLELATEMAG